MKGNMLEVTKSLVQYHESHMSLLNQDISFVKDLDTQFGNLSNTLTRLLFAFLQNEDTLKMFSNDFLAT